MTELDATTNNSSASTSDARWTLISLFTLSFWHEWFTRPRGGLEALRLATPVIISSSCFALMNFADRLYMTWYDQRGMAAAFQAGCLLWGLITLPVGIASFTNTFVSQYNGAGKKYRIGLVVWQGVFFGLAIGVLYVAATPLVELLFQKLGAAGDFARMERNYWFFFSLGASACIAHEPLTAYFCGRRDMKTVMWIGIASVLLNVILDPILIFGVRGYCRWGVEGAAIASAISLWFKFFLYLALALRRDRVWNCGLRKRFHIHWGEMYRLTKYGAMSGLQVFADNGCFTLFVLLIGWFGEDVSAAAGIAFNLNALAFMPMVGLGIATTTMVGNDVGAGRFDLATRSTKTAFALGAALTGFFALAFFGAPHFFLDVYALRRPDEFEAIRSLAATSLRFISAYLLFDAANVVFASSLRGAGDAKFIMLTTGTTATIILTSVLCGAIFFDRGVNWCWTFLTLYVILNASAFAVRFWQGGWKSHALVHARKASSVGE